MDLFESIEFHIFVPSMLIDLEKNRYLFEQRDKRISNKNSLDFAKIMFVLQVYFLFWWIFTDIMHNFKIYSTLQNLIALHSCVHRRPKSN